MLSKSLTIHLDKLKAVTTERGLFLNDLMQNIVDETVCEALDCGVLEQMVCSYNYTPIVTFNHLVESPYGRMTSDVASEMTTVKMAMIKFIHEILDTFSMSGLTKSHFVNFTGSIVGDSLLVISFSVIDGERYERC